MTVTLGRLQWPSCRAHSQVGPLSHRRLIQGNDKQKMPAWGPPEKGRPAGVSGGGWRPRPDAVVGRGAADLSVGSESARAAVSGLLAGQPRFSRPDTRVQRAGAGGGGPRAMGATGDRPGVGTRRAARQAPGTAAGAARGATGSGNSDTDLTTSKNR